MVARKEGAEPGLLAQALDAKRHGDAERAAKLAEQILGADPFNRDAGKLLAAIRRRQGRLAEATQLLALLNSRHPQDPSIGTSLADILLRQRRWKEADALLAEVTARHPDYAQALLDRARIAQTHWENAKAEALVEEALRRFPANAEAWVMAGTLALERNDLDAAREASRRALELAPGTALAYANLGQVAWRDGDPEAARRFYVRGLSMAPKQPRLRFILGIAELYARNYVPGWAGYRWRRQVEPPIGADFSYGLPRWQPRHTEIPAPKRVLVWMEQGVGDEILFAGLLPDMIAQGQAFRLLCDPRLLPIVQRSFPGIDAIGRSDDWTAENLGCDAQIAIGDLGALYRRSTEEFPERASYLKADPEKAAAIRRRYEALARGRKLIGIGWRSSNYTLGGYKSLRLADFAPLLRRPDVLAINLQYGDCREEFAALQQETGLQVHDDSAVDPLQSLDDQAAQIAALDGVISTPNSAVHLAGALGCPVRLILADRRGVQWYWGFGVSRPDWYSGIRIERAGAGETPEALVARAVEALLADLAKGG